MFAPYPYHLLEMSIPNSGLELAYCAPQIQWNLLPRVIKDCHSDESYDHHGVQK